MHGRRGRLLGFRQREDQGNRADSPRDYDQSGGSRLIKDSPPRREENVCLTIAVPTAAEPLAVDNGDDGRYARVGQLNDIAHDRAGDGRAVFVWPAHQLLDGVAARLKPADDQRLVELGAAPRAEGERLSVWVARTGDAQGKRALRAALAAAGLQHDLMDDERRAVFPACAAEMRGIAAQRMKPFGIGAARSAFTVA